MLLYLPKYYRAVFVLVFMFIVLSSETRNTFATPSRNDIVKHRIVVDTDAGSDDLMALAFLLGRPDVEIVGITLVTGLSSIDAGAQNILRLLALTNAGDIPVYIGAREHLQKTTPFPQAWMDASEAAGKVAADVEPRSLPRKGAVEFLARVMMQKNSGIQILALGPLTNLAIALRAAGKNKVYATRTVIMGGAVHVPGNLNLRVLEFQIQNDKAEWNFYSDPLAASEVLNSPLILELVPLDATQQVKYDTCFVNKIMAGIHTPNLDYVGRLLESARGRIEGGTYYAWDPLAAVVLLNPETVHFEEAQFSISVSGPYEGQTQLVTKGQKMRFATRANANRFAEIFNAGLNRKTAGSTAIDFFCR